MKKAGKRTTTMAFQLIGVIVTLLAVFGVLVSTIGYVNFTNSIKNEYSVTTFHMADTAATLVNGDHLEDYLDGKYQDEYRLTRSYLDGYCRRMWVSLIYVISVDASDYGRFVSVFNSVNNSVDNSEYKEWELGHPRDTTNDEYRRKYQTMYEQTAIYETVYRMNPTDGSRPHITTMVPVKDMYNNTVGILCIQRPFSELRALTRPYLVTVIISTLILALITATFISLYIRRKYVKPVRKISEEAARFAKDNQKGEPLEGISNLREIHNLATSIDKMETDMVRYIDNLTQAAAEKERIGTEMNLAKDIQANSVPTEFPPFPDRKEFDIYAVMDPAREVGGDFYNFGFIDDDHLALVIGDVSGKGVPAALFMMVSNILITNTATMGKTPADVLEAVNNSLFEHNTVEMFVTIWLGILEISTGKIIAANAGHEYPAVMTNGRFSLLKDKHGFVAAGMRDMKYTNYEIQLQPGDKLFVYTDGVPEATNEAEELFGTDRMIDVLNKDPEASPEKILANITEGINDFVKDAEQFDDLTMLCLEYRGKEVGEHDI